MAGIKRGIPILPHISINRESCSDPLHTKARNVPPLSGGLSEGSASCSRLYPWQLTWGLVRILSPWVYSSSYGGGHGAFKVP